MNTTAEQFTRQRKKYSRVELKHFPRSVSNIESRSKLLEMLLKQSSYPTARQSNPSIIFNNDKLQEFSRSSLKRKSVTERAVTPQNLPKIMLSQELNLCPESEIEFNSDNRQFMKTSNTRRKYHQLRFISKSECKNKQKQHLFVKQDQKEQFNFTRSRRRVDFETFNYMDKLNTNKIVIKSNCKIYK